MAMAAQFDAGTRYGLAGYLPNIRRHVRGAPSHNLSGSQRPEREASSTIRATTSVPALDRLSSDKSRPTRKARKRTFDLHVEVSYDPPISCANLCLRLVVETCEGLVSLRAAVATLGKSVAH
jgi:hypothetical protein